MNALAHQALKLPMTLEYQILQRLRFGPIMLHGLSDMDDDALQSTLAHMTTKKQICIRNGQMSLFWHRHMIAPALAA